MQIIIKAIIEALENHFDKKPRLTDSGIKLNVESLNSRDINALNRIRINTMIEQEIRRSGKGLVIIINC